MSLVRLYAVFCISIFLVLGQIASADTGSCGEGRVEVLANTKRFSDLTAEILACLLNDSGTEPGVYRNAVGTWPDSVPIWPHLRGRASKERFIRHVIEEQDSTDKMPYLNFDNLCTGFSAQIFARYSNRVRLSKQAIDHLKNVKVEGGGTPEKFRMPVFMAAYPGHFFNAFLLDESRPGDPDSYLLLEPQNDQWLRPGVAKYEESIGRYGVMMHELTDFGSNRVFQLRPAGLFLADPAGKLKRARSERLRYLAQRFYIAETEKQNYDYYVKGKSFERFIWESANRVWKFSDDELIEFGTFVIGAKYRTSPSSSVRELTMDDYLRMVGRSKLRGRLEKALRKH